MFNNWQQAGAGEHRVELSANAGIVDSIVHLPENYQDSDVKAVAICCHPHPLYEGSMSNKVVHTLAKSFTKIGLISLRFNFRGVGKSEGEHDNGVGETEDLVSICQHVKEYFPDAQIWLSGFSFGSYIAANAAHQVGASQLLSVSPPVEHYDFTQINDPKCPWMIVMGEVDEVVSPGAVFNWVDQTPGRYQLLKFPETGHFYHGKLVKLTDQLINHYGPIVEAL